MSPNEPRTMERSGRDSLPDRGGPGYEVCKPEAEMGEERALALEVITLPVSDIERALHFYADQVGFALDVDYTPTPNFRVVQLTPPGSGCSIQLTNAGAGADRNAYLVVTDLEATRAGLVERGVEVSEVRHKTPVGAWDGGFADGVDPERGDYASFADFVDPEGNRWVLQERGFGDCDADPVGRP
jgi:catechol 2,3-dioxygenase-like lactoylglutathione lyase family enzyme